jgi:phosphoribosyl 1,2-cyclic phosphate phosphodiesterase
MTRLTFRGTGDSMGVPRVYCDCEVCNEARLSGVNRRFRSALQIEDDELGQMWIDCGPDWGRQMEAAGVRAPERMLITHAHFDHIGGLVEWADACRWLEQRGEAYSPEEVTHEINNRFPWVNRQIHFNRADDGLTFRGWEVQTWKVCHGKNGYSYAYRFGHRETGRSWAYCSDAIALSEKELEPLYGLDLLILGTSFYEEPYPFETRSVYDVKEALVLLEELRPMRTVFTHMSHDIDLRLKYALPDDVQFATTGLVINI